MQHLNILPCPSRTLNVAVSLRQYRRVHIAVEIIVNIFSFIAIEVVDGVIASRSSSSSHRRPSSSLAMKLASPVDRRLILVVRLERTVVDIFHRHIVPPPSALSILHCRNVFFFDVYINININVGGHHQHRSSTSAVNININGHHQHLHAAAVCSILILLMVRSAIPPHETVASR